MKNVAWEIIPADLKYSACDTNPNKTGESAAAAAAQALRIKTTTIF